MTKNRLEAFSDGVIAIIITIMVLELKAPHEASLASLGALGPVFISYVLSFALLAIYWNNHHHLMHAVQKIDGSVLWANMHLLFWLSLIPFTTAWMGETHFAATPAATYGVNLLMAAVAYWVLVKRLIGAGNSKLAKAIGSDSKGNISVVLYLLALPLAFVHTGFSYAIYVAVTLLWLVPDKRIEKKN